MQLHERLSGLESPVRVAVIGAGTFGAHVAYQVERVPGMALSAVADVDTERARATFRNAGVADDAVVLVDGPDEADAAIDAGRRAVLADGAAVADTSVDAVVESTGVPVAAARHAFAALTEGKDVVMVSVETDSVVGPLLSETARNNGATYSMAYGDEPAHVVALVDWARTVGLDVVAAGKCSGSEFQPYGTPDDALDRFGLSESYVEEKDPNPQMYNSFMDGTKLSVELCAAANALGLEPDAGGVHKPSTDLRGLLDTFRPAEAGGELERTGVIDACTSEERFSAWVVTTTPNEAARSYFAGRFNVPTADDGAYQVFDHSFHMAPETTVSIAHAAVYGEPTGAVRSQETEVVAAAKRDLDPGDEIDGGGGYTIYGQLEPADVAAEAGHVPLELLDGAEVLEPVSRDEVVTYDDVDLRETFLYHLRRVQEGA